MEMSFFGLVDKWSIMVNNKSCAQTLAAKGWFGTTEYSRESYYSQQFNVMPGSSTIPYLYECPIYRPSWDIPVDIVGVVFFVIGMISVAISICDSVIVKTILFEDRVEVCLSLPSLFVLSPSLTYT